MDRCPHCECDQRTRKRDFPQDSWTKLVALGEVSPAVAGKPVCDDCADEFRQILIDESEMT